MKVKSPKSGYLITVGGKTYNKLEKEGYFGNKKVKSPKSGRYIKTSGKTYDNLYSEGFFKSLTGIDEIDQQILLNLSLDDIKNIPNKHLNNLITNDFWCQWLDRHYNINEKHHCKDIAKALSLEDVNQIYEFALKNGHVGLVKYLLDHKLVNTLEYKIPYYTLEPLWTAIKYNHLEVVKLLLAYYPKEDLQDGVISALFNSVDNITILTYLLKTYQYDKDVLSEALSDVTRNKNMNIMQLLVSYGADPSNSVISAIHSNDIDILNYILSLNPKIPNDAISIALGLRKYEMLKLILDYMGIEIYMSTDIEKLEKQLLPFIQDKGVYYEVKYKWYYKEI